MLLCMHTYVSLSIYYAAMSMSCTVWKMMMMMTCVYVYDMSMSMYVAWQSCNVYAHTWYMHVANVSMLVRNNLGRGRWFDGPCSDDPLVLRPINQKTHWHCCDNLLVRKGLIGPKTIGPRPTGLKSVILVRNPISSTAHWRWSEDPFVQKSVIDIGPKMMGHVHSSVFFTRSQFLFASGL